MMTFLFVGIGVVLLIAMLLVMLAAGGRGRHAAKPAPTAQGKTPLHGRAMGSGDN
jgi:hypothetical protein